MKSFADYNKSSEATLTVKELDIWQQPREKAETYGYHTLTKAELLALILRTGIQGTPITEITKSLLAANDGSLHLLMRRSVEEIQSCPGMGPVKAGQVKAIMELIKRYGEEEQQANNRRNIISKSADLYELMRFELSNLNKEEIWILTLNRRNQVTGRHRITKGSSDASIFDLHAALKIALINEASSIAMFHNHPSGNTLPSPQDDAITRSLKNGAAAINVRLIDHLIITSEGYYSYADSGRL